MKHEDAEKWALLLKFASDNYRVDAAVFEKHLLEQFPEPQAQNDALLRCVPQTYFFTGPWKCVVCGKVHPGNIEPTETFCKGAPIAKLCGPCSREDHVLCKGTRPGCECAICKADQPVECLGPDKRRIIVEEIPEPPVEPVKKAARRFICTHDPAMDFQIARLATGRHEWVSLLHGLPSLEDPKVQQAALDAYFDFDGTGQLSIKAAIETYLKWGEK